MSDFDVLRTAAQAGAKKVLEIKDLKTYLYARWGIVKAVDGVDLTLNDGESFGLVGESGCGKSMLSLSIVRLLPKPAGRIVGGQILLDGDDLVKKSESEMRRIRGSQVSMVLQDPMTALDPVFSVGTQLTETIAAGGRTEKQRLLQRAEELLRLVRIPAPADRMKCYPFEMSGGMRQRVVGAIALARRPRLLIADEPTTSLDVTTQANYLRLLKELQEEMRLTLLFITHDFGIVARVCHRVGVMYAGKIVEVGDVFDIFDDPLHPYTRCLIDSVPKLEKKVARLVNIKGQPPALHNLPLGCAFAPRCPERSSNCRAQEFPPYIHVKPGHSVACWRCC